MLDLEKFSTIIPNIAKHKPNWVEQISKNINHNCIVFTINWKNQNII